MLEQIAAHAASVLIGDAQGRYTGTQLLEAGAGVSQLLGKRANERVALLAAPGLHYVAGMLGTWQSGAAYVPLCPTHPAAELEYIIRDCEATVVLVQEELKHLLPELSGVRVIDLVLHPQPQTVFSCDPESDAMLLYTSGTTGKPKGAVHTHRSLRVQVECLLQAWEWQHSDRIMHFLPLHHTHGIINKLLCALAAGAYCELLPKFSADVVWEKLITETYSVFMAVPTIYSKLIEHWENASPAQQQKASAACKALRLMVSGSAALPVPVLEKWKNISGHTLLERYGMTEIGMALSNPLHGERRPGFVGLPLPGVLVRVVDEAGNDITAEGCMGELQVRGKNLFSGYYNRPEVTAESFVTDEHGLRWFKTGDMVSIENGYYKIAGRMSSDIIKSGGYKISALEIENVLLLHPDIAACAVAGLPDETWGEKVAAALVLKPGKTIITEELKTFLKPHLAPYKQPTVIKLFEELPRNTMGKVLKKELLKLF
jgi:malonyl-CoA/methylmalonyl-CoA synthetase